MRRPFFLLAILGLLAACSEYDVKTTSEVQGVDDDGEQPDIQVDPAFLDFGSVDVTTGDEVTQVITVSNVGEADLHIDDIGLDAGETEFTVGAISSVIIPKGSSAELAVTFKPETAYDVSDAVLIESDDPDEPVTEVPLDGIGLAPQIDVSPADYAFGDVYIGCDKTLEVVVSNVGNAPLEVTGFSYSATSEDLVFDSNEVGVGSELPWTLGPIGDDGSAEYVIVYVDYVPYDEVEDSAYLYVASNDPFTPEAIVHQTAGAAMWGDNIDVYEQPIQAETDIIFAVDRSCSMDDDIRSVEENFSTFANTLADLDADYHVAATVDDDGCINSVPYIDNTFSAAEAEDAIAAMIALGSSYGTNTEMAFTLLEATLGEIGTGGCNEGLVREDAKLNLVGVSDEVEQSRSPWSSYVAAFQALKADPDDVVFHAIGGDVPGGCGSNEPYTGYYEAVVATGGLFLSICATDWGDHLESLAEASADTLDTFMLTETPVEDTIVVSIDGVPTRLGWVYLSENNSVLFADGYVPEGGSTIEIEYAVMGTCDE